MLSANIVGKDTFIHNLAKISDNFCKVFLHKFSLNVNYILPVCRI